MAGSFGCRLVQKNGGGAKQRTEREAMRRLTQGTSWGKSGGGRALSITEGGGGGGGSDCNKLRGRRIVLLSSMGTKKLKKREQGSCKRWWEDEVETTRVKNVVKEG